MHTHANTYIQHTHLGTYIQHNINVKMHLYACNLILQGDCFLGNTYGKYGSDASGSSCNNPCQTKPSQICGGSWRNSVYSAFLNASSPCPSCSFMVNKSWTPTVSSIAPASGYENTTLTVTGNGFLLNAIPVLNASGTNIIGCVFPF
jgi:hypothetical protein